MLLPPFLLPRKMCIKVVRVIRLGFIATFYFNLIIFVEKKAREKNCACLSWFLVSFMKLSFVVPVGTQATHGSGNEQRRHIHPGNVRVKQGKKILAPKNERTRFCDNGKKIFEVGGGWKPKSLSTCPALEIQIPGKRKKSRLFFTFF